MKTKSQTNKLPILSSDDINALRRVFDITFRVQNSYSEEDVLMSPECGDVLKIAELSRMRGILSFIMDNKTVEVNP